MPRDKKAHISKLKGLLKDADELYLATDEDREGEAIAWHLLDELKPKDIPVHRMVFHEITKAAILAAVANPRETSTWTSSRRRRPGGSSTGSTATRSRPVLWRKVMSGLSAGRVQSVATRLVVDRERERMAFRVASYWDLEGTFDAGAEHEQRMFPAKLHSHRRPAGRQRLRLRPRRPAEGGEGRSVHLDRAGAEALVTALADTTYDVRSVEAKPYARSPYAPFRTTTLQQEASRKLGMGASVTMSVAQRLYENGFITYMRTDSTTLSERRGRRGPVAGARAVRRGVPPRPAADLRQQGQERPGGARGDPARRRVVPHAGADRADRRPVPPLRADLDAHRRVADEGRRRPVGVGPASAAPRPTARTSSSPRPAG